MRKKFVYDKSMGFFSSIINEVVNFLFPKSKQIASLESLSPSDLLRMLPPSQQINNENVIALFDYKHPLVREMIWELKYNGNRIVAGKLGSMLYDLIIEEVAERSFGEKWSKPILIPTPISDKRRNERGWNQSELLTQAISSKDVEKIFEYLPRQLVKHRHTESQTKTAGKQERLTNLNDSMKVLHPDAVVGKSIVLIDDVYTTGATYKEAKRALKNAGAKRVVLFTIAH